MHLLAKHTDVQKKLREEVKKVLNGEEANYENVQEMKYLSNVIKEGMRMFGPAVGVTRLVTQDTTIADYKVPKGSKLYLNFYALHFSEEFYEKPLEFNPDRFENKNQQQSYTWIPFSAGPRVCKKFF